MKPTTQTCDHHRLEVFLQGDLNAVEEGELAVHLNDCVACRQRLEATAAEPACWSKASELLQPNEFFDEEAAARSPQRSLQIQHVLDALAPTDDPEMLGRLGGYEVSGVIGTGGMGVVLKAFDKSLDRTVAIKVMAPHLASSGAARKRFAREAKAAAAVLHPNVMAIHGVSNDESLPYLVMPYLRGASLQKRIDDEGPLPVSEILRIGSQIGAGLAAAHAQGLVHRDIKPANMLLEDGVERVAITDFGLARAVDDATMTRTGVIAGTPQFMSPEQARGESVDQRSDLFSLGSVMYAMCTGRPPFRAETSYGILRRITDNEPRPIREISPEIPEWLCAIIAKLMSKRPEDRVASAEEVAELLEECLAHVQQPTTVPLPQSVEQLSQLLRSAKDGHPPDRAHGRFTRRARTNALRLMIGVASAFMLALAGLLIVLELGKGTLTIESDVDDVPLRIMQGDKVVETMTVSQSGGKVRIAAGAYVVEIDGKSDGIVVDDGTVSLQRGGKAIVRVRKRDLGDDESSLDQFIDRAVVEAHIRNKLGASITLNCADKPLHAVIKDIANAAGIYNVLLDSGGLAAEGVTRDEPVTVQLERPIRLSSALRLVLEPLRLEYVIENEVLKITGERIAVYPKLYDATRYLRSIHNPAAADRSDHTKRQQGGPTDRDFDALIELITSTVAPESWDDKGGPGAIAAFPERLALVIHQTKQVHDQIDAFLSHPDTWLGQRAAQTPPPMSKRNAPNTGDLRPDAGSVEEGVMKQEQAFVSPVFDAEESAEFRSTITELKTRLEHLDDGGVFATLDTSEPDSTRQSIHQRLERLQGDESPESQDHQTGDKQ